MRRSCVAVFAILMLMPQFVQAEFARLTVIIRGLVPATGAVEVTLFNSAEKFLQIPMLQKSERVDGNEEITFDYAGLIDGDYAIVVVHDENDNGVLDTGFLGFGGESYGYSNDAKSWLGRPSYEAAKFTVGTDDLEIVITLD